MILKPVLLPAEPGEPSTLSDVDVAILAGGFGTRLRAVLGDVPKVLAPIGEHVFLDLVLGWLRGFGARRVILCLGHGAAPVLAHLEKEPLKGMTVVPVVEPEPLGTAGALRYAAPHFVSDPVLALNGDTLVDVDLAGFLDRHRRSGCALSLLCSHVSDTSRYGSVDLNENGIATRFLEKDSRVKRPGLISAGLYLFSRSCLAELVQETGTSLERDFLPTRRLGSIRGDLGAASFLDIGTARGHSTAVRLFSGLKDSRFERWRWLSDARFGVMEAS